MPQLDEKDLKVIRLDNGEIIFSKVLVTDKSKDKGKANMGFSTTYFGFVYSYMLSTATRSTRSNKSIICQ